MAYVSNMNTDEEQNPNVPQGSISPTGGGSGVRLAPSSAIAPAAAGASGTPPSAGGQFASLNQYLNANQGQAEPLAGKLTAGINQQYNTLQGQNVSTLNDINSQVAANAVPSNANAIISQEAVNPVSFASNPGNIASFQNLLNASYSGPVSAESTPGYTAQQNAINNAIATGQQATKTEAGRENLLSQNETTPTTGVTALNSAILSQSPTALNKVETAYQPFSSLLTGLQSGGADINKQIAQNQANAQQANQASNANINNQINAFNTGLNTTVSQDEAARQAYNTALQDYQNQYNPLSTDIANLNELAKNATQLTPFGYKYGQIANPFAAALNQPVNNTVANVNTVATPEQYAQANAFQNLIAGLNLGIPAPILNQSTIGQAGTYTAPNVFNGPTVAQNEAQLAADAANYFGNGPQLSPTTPEEAAQFNQIMQSYIPFSNLLQQLDPNLKGRV